MVTSRTLLNLLDEPDEEVEARMIRALDALLIHPPRVAHPPGVMLFRQNDTLDGIYILLKGQVKLYQEMEGREVVFHSATAGRIIGLLSLTRRSRALFNCCTATDLELIHIPFEDLDRALQQSEALLVAFITVLLRSMARRSTRLVELQREVLSLNKHLAHERDTLARTLEELQRTQNLLIESEKMATLGQMAAGVAHELNNPVAAIDRSADFLQQDLLNLVSELHDGHAFETMLRRAIEQPPVSTREQREHRKQLAAQLKNEQLAESLVSMGIHDVEDYKRMDALCSGPLDQHIPRLQSYYQIGRALRNVRSCSQRIGGLVKSLRSYSRPDDNEIQEADVQEGLEDTLSLFSNRLRDVTVERVYRDVPLVHVSPGPLNQVWTNLIGNALDAMKNQGQLTVETQAARDVVCVKIIDNGPGIAPEHLKKIFDARFTTRQGRVEYGLGLGLPITQAIVSRHGGTIRVESRPGHTTFCVCLPIAQNSTV